MGGSSSQIIGYRWYAAILMVLCHGPVDCIKKILIDDDKVLLNGTYEAGDHLIDDENLFGGDSSQGGISGILTFLDGRPDQGIDSRLRSYQGEDTDPSLVPAYRGVASMFLHGSKRAGMYLGNNPYLKTWKSLIQRIYSTSTGEDQWYKERALVFAPVASTYPEYDFNQLSWELTGLDGADGSSHVAVGNAGTTSFVVYAADSDSDKVFDITLQITASTEMRQVVGGEQVGEYSWIRKGGNYGDVASFNRYMIEISEPAATYYFNHGVSSEDYDDSERFASIQIQVKNGATVTCICDTVDGYMARGQTLGLHQYMKFKASSSPYYDMNPAHIIRECLTDRVWGNGNTNVNDDSFKKCADTLYDEQLGMSIKWTQEGSVEDFIAEILKHINAVLYDEPLTGLQTLKLIRDDYDESSLLLLDSSNILSTSKFERLAFDDLINQVTITYTIIENGESGTITVQDSALQAMHGDINSKSIDYKGFSNITNAGRAGIRDLKAISSPWMSVEIVVMKSVAGHLRQGDVFKWTSAKHGAYEVIMRITAIDLGDGKSNSVTITCTQDLFSLPDSTITTTQISVPKTNSTIADLNHVMVFETPYYAIARDKGDDQATTLFENYPDASFLAVAVGRPFTGLGSLSAELYLLNSSSKYIRNSSVQFCPSAVLEQPLDYLDSVISVKYSNTQDFDIIDLSNDLPIIAQIGSEILVIQSISDNALDSSYVDITVYRGGLDTHPSTHFIGDVLYIWGFHVGGSETQYSSGESIDAKLLNRSLSALSNLGSATANHLTFEGRAARPYPPNNVKICGEYYPNSVLGTLTITWSHRNRLLETSGSPLNWTDDSVTLEDGVEYVVDLYDGNNVLISSTNVGAVNTFDVDYSGVETARIKIKLYSVRSTNKSYQIFEHSVVNEQVISKPSLVSAIYLKDSLIAASSISKKFTTEDIDNISDFNVEYFE